MEQLGFIVICWDLSDQEAAQLRREFWEARHTDKKLGGVKSLNVERSKPNARDR